MTKIIDEVLKHIPSNAKVSDVVFEGANIVIYTKNKDFFLDSNGTIKEIVNDIKKRVEVRPDPSLCMGVEDAEKKIREILPEEAQISNVTFDHQRARVIIEAEKPGLAIGKQGDLLKEIRKKTMWVPLIKRTPALKSKIIENIRQVLYENNDFRRKFLNKIGHRIYDGWKREKRHEWIRVTFLGGARQVGKSCLLLQTPESNILMDCGIHPARSLNDPSAYPYLDAPEFKLNEVDAIILSHAHIDHCGLIPYLYKMGYEGPVYTTAPTRDIAALLCLDTISIAQKEGRDPIYTTTDIKNMVKHTICLGYEEVTDITPDIRLTLYNAGHTLGSSMAHLHIGNGLHNLLYTSDMNYETSNLLATSVTSFPRLETVITEATLGAKEDVQKTRGEAEEDFLKEINDTINNKGKVLLPVLGTGRAQEIMVILEKAMKEKKIPDVPIYVQGMVWDITAIHTTYPDFFNSKVRRSVFHKDENPFLSPIFKHVSSQKEQQEVIESGTPCIVMATSGMLVGGASIEYFKNLAENARNTLIFTCYQAEGSLGRILQNGVKEVNMGTAEKPDMVNVKSKICTISGFSGHSSRNQLIAFFKHLDPRPKKIIIQHGESSKCLDLASSLHKLMNVETSAPKNLESIRIK
ncbi:MAG: beta-CASP ribonuclease aCPSF1 [Candidatus Nanoarchaeia archaeon]|nr:beta-CASP ribonuclease aCPSF1 [Candidatus Nanoarchaeia archaeon]